MFKEYLKAIIDRSPRDNIASVCRRFSHHKNNYYQPEEVFRSPQYARSQRLYDFYHRYNKIVSHHSSWRCPGFHAQTILEVGPGPLLGWGPLAVFHQCRHFIGIEPHYNEEIIKDRRFRGTYLLGVHRDLSAIYNQHTNFKHFQQAIKDTTTNYRSIGDLDLQASVDVVLSNSCLEHIEDLESTVEKLYDIAKPGSCFLHCVDFGNHISKLDPFHSIYSVPKNISSFRQFGLNLMRPPDILDLFRSVGFQTECIPYYWGNELDTENLHSSWLARYSNRDLRLKVAILVGVKQ